ncbi:MAG TPA: carboxypeptidase-like regulatory domain-containing protein, partial [Candidatus Saccharimonadales bacterium]|nr:carboxypeptidase-like regulatory domain-containing protein [Candidatus Saccharimonadales bacterium]
MDRKLSFAGLVWALEFVLVFGFATLARAQSRSEKSAGSDAMSTLAGLGSISGTVKAPKEFKAAKVYAKNVDKNVVYMVFTEGGRFQAVDLFPGNYEVSVSKNGFTGGDAQKITIAAGGSATADFTLKEGTYRPNQQMRAGLPKGEPLVSYDELYPPSHARETIERTCIMCHGPDFLPNKQWDEEQWNA